MRRFAQVLSADVLAKAALGVVSVALIRFMPSEEFARYALAVAVATVGAQILAGGFNRIYIIGHDRLGVAGRAGPFLATQLALLVLLALLAIPFADALGGTYPLAVAVATGMVLSEFAKTLFQRELAFARYSAIEVGRALTQALAIAILIGAMGSGLRAPAVLAMQAAALLGVVAVALVPRLKWHDLFDVASSAEITRSVVAGPYAVLFVYFALVAVFSQVDILMLKGLADNFAVASYAAAFRYYSLLMLALGAMHAVLLPAVQQAESAGALDALYRQHFRLLVLFAPAVALAAWLAGWVLPWVDGGRYPDAVPAFRILAASAVISFACSPHVNLLMKLHRFRFLLGLIIAALAIAVLLNLVLVPRAGAVGAAWATLMASACVTVPVFLAARRLRSLGPAGSVT